MQANTVEEVRSAAIRLKYDSIEHEVTVNQAAAEPEPEPTATELPYLSGIYFGNQYGATEADYNYSGKSDNNFSNFLQSVGSFISQ